MDLYHNVDDKIQKGYRYLSIKEVTACCDDWLEAWEEIKDLFRESGAKDIFELDKTYDWTQFISNYAQDLEMELHNAGLLDKSYHQKRIVYCKELLKWCGDNESVISNTRRGMAEGYFESGEVALGEQLFSEWLREDPDWGWGYIGWSDCYWFGPGNNQYTKAEEILLSGYARSGLRDRIYVVDRLIGLYKEMGQADKVKEYKKKQLALQRAEVEGSLHFKATPIKAEKIERNGPCWCGSGKKYKKCCGA